MLKEKRLYWSLAHGASSDDADENDYEPGDDPDNPDNPRAFVNSFLQKKLAPASGGGTCPSDIFSAFAVGGLKLVEGKKNDPFIDFLLTNYSVGGVSMRLPQSGTDGRTHNKMGAHMIPQVSAVWRSFRSPPLVTVIVEQCASFLSWFRPLSSLVEYSYVPAICLRRKPLT